MAHHLSVPGAFAYIKLSKPSLPVETLQPTPPSTDSVVPDNANKQPNDEPSIDAPVGASAEPLSSKHEVCRFFCRCLARRYQWFALSSVRFPLSTRYRPAKHEQPQEREMKTPGLIIREKQKYPSMLGRPRAMTGGSTSTTLTDSFRRASLLTPAR